MKEKSFHHLVKIVMLIFYPLLMIAEGMAIFVVLSNNLFHQMLLQYKGIAGLGNIFSSEISIYTCII